MPMYRIKPGYKFGNGRGGDLVELTEFEALGQECRLEFVSEKPSAPVEPDKPEKPETGESSSGRKR